MRAVSRGPGRWQRLILTALENGPVAVTPDTDSRAIRNAVRRAAHTLEAQGRLTLTMQVLYGRARLVAYLPHTQAPACVVFTGRDGKTYRTPTRDAA